MKMFVTVKFAYDIPDDLDDRERVYGTTDIKECATIDVDLSPDELLESAQALATTVTITPDLHQGEIWAVEKTHTA